MTDVAGISTRHAGGTNRKKRVVSKRGLDRRRKQRELRKANMAEALAEAQSVGIALGEHPGTIYDVMEKVFIRTHALFMFTARKVDELDPNAKPTTNRDGDSLWWQSYDRQGNLVISPSKWPALEKTLREELFDQAIRMGALNIDERKVNIQQQILDILSRALSNAAAAAKLPEDQRRALGAALRAELEPFTATEPDSIDAEILKSDHAA